MQQQMDEQMVQFSDRHGLGELLLLLLHPTWPVGQSVEFVATDVKANTAICERVCERVCVRVCVCESSLLLPLVECSVWLSH